MKMRMLLATLLSFLLLNGFVCAATIPVTWDFSTGNGVSDGLGGLDFVNAYGTVNVFTETFTGTDAQSSNGLDLSLGDTADFIVLSDTLFVEEFQEFTDWTFTLYSEAGAGLQDFLFGGTISVPAGLSTFSVSDANMQSTLGVLSYIADAPVSIKNLSAMYTEPVPEPSTLLLLGAGLAGLVAYRRKAHR